MIIVNLARHRYNRSLISQNFKEHKDMVYLTEKGKSQSARAFLLISLISIAPSLYAARHTAFAFQAPVDFKWAGPFVGGYAGGGFSNANFDTNVGSVSDSSYFSSTADISSVNQNGSNNLNPASPLLGVQLGDNFTLSPLVTVGLVLDYGYFHLNEKSDNSNVTYPSGTGNYSEQTSVNTNWLYTIRGRAGYTPATSWPMMFYATAGLAVTNLQVSNDFTDTSSLAGAGSGSGSNNQTGWTLGAGFEAPVTQHITINAEYLYVNFGSVSANRYIQNSAGGFGVPANSLTSTFATSINLDASLFRLGLNYKF